MMCIGRTSEIALTVF